jgi:hypothetical protein
MKFKSIHKAKRLVRKLARSSRFTDVKVTKQIVNRSDFVFQCHRMEKQLVRLSIPLEKIRIKGALPFDTQHPFIRAIKSGPDELRQFYDTFQPSNLAEMYGLDLEGQDMEGLDLPQWEMPWTGRDNRVPPPGEAGLDASHGVSFYGPGTDEKVALEYRRLISVRDAIEKNGFQPERYGDIEGYGLVSPTDYRFYVRGGKHRVAALASLGHTEIPVSFRSYWPTAIYSANLNDWPLVANGEIAPQAAEAIFDRYF